MNTFQLDYEIEQTNKKQFIVESLAIKESATELSPEEYIEARQWETRLSMSDYCDLGELVAGAKSGYSYRLKHLVGDGIVEIYCGLTRLTPKGMKIAKFFVGALS